MTAERWTLIFLIAWAIAFVGSFVAFALTPAKDFGLSAGWNKIGVFMGWQLVAMVLAFFAGTTSRKVEPGRTLRWLGVLPVSVFGLMALAVIALLLWSNWSKPAPEGLPTPGAPVTVPAPTSPPAESAITPESE